MTACVESVLLGDIGATNARFAVLTGGVLGPVTWVEVAHYPQLTDAVGALLQAQFRETTVSDALLAVAGPVDGGRCAFTNCAWTVDHHEVRDRFAG